MNNLTKLLQNLPTFEKPERDDVEAAIFKCEQIEISVMLTNLKNLEKWVKEVTQHIRGIVEENKRSYT